ncbi:MAG: ArsR family transcriptional regulator [Ktedonobacteraceae bacterium]|nr:ArsR family transcriptional regulator [Ktedonobacteraceae bacterium]
MRSPEFFKLLAHDIRWTMLTLLARSDYNGQELVRALRLPPNLVSYHLRLLAEQHLVTERRNSADERSFYYSLDIDLLRTLYISSGESLHPLLAAKETEDAMLQERLSHLPGTPVRVLFLCTHNSARSQMAEGIMRHLSGGRIEVTSAGSQPTELHPLAVRACLSQGIDISGQRPRHVNDLMNQNFDYVITVCDRVREVCPAYPGDPECSHWSFPDPAETKGTEEERYRAFEQVALQLRTRIRYLLRMIEQKYAHAH